MTDLECFRATVSHRRPERILYGAGFVEDLRKRLVAHTGTEDLGAHYGFYGSRGLPIETRPGTPKRDYAKYWEGETLPAGTTFDGYGVAMVPSGFYHFWGYISPLRKAASLADIEGFPLDDIAALDFSKMAAAAREHHAAGRVVGGWVGHIYENAWQIRGYEEFLLDMMERPAWAECLLGRLAEVRYAVAMANARAGADVLHCGDDIANQNALMFQPELWRKMMLPLWRRIWQDAKAINPEIKVWYHSDGNIGAVVGDLVEAGLDILNPLQPECLDIDAVHRRYGARISFDGTIGTQSTMPFGTPDAVRARVKEVIEKYGRHGGLIISPTHVLEPEVPIANIEAFAAACREYGTATA